MQRRLASIFGSFPNADPTHLAGVAVALEHFGMQPLGDSSLEAIVLRRCRVFEHIPTRLEVRAVVAAKDEPTGGGQFAQAPRPCHYATADFLNVPRPKNLAGIVKAKG